MNKEKSYLTNPFNDKVHSIVAGIDKDVEHGEDILMLGFGLVMMSTFFAPFVPPSILLPLVAITFAISSSVARINYRNMKQKLQVSITQIDAHDQIILKPLSKAFGEQPPLELGDSFNPLKNGKRTFKCILGGILINPFWMPIFYMMGMQIDEDKNLGLLNLAIIGVERRIAPRLSKN
ncbi:MAG: hypothetical protein HOP23_13550 [Methylococcaceae bacterium]|nr:hypothetical protein [Methylococcaceae bacterium]